MHWFVNIAKYFNTKTKYEEFTTFARHIGDFGDGQRARRLIEDQMKRNIYWRQSLRPQVEKYLDGLQLVPPPQNNMC